MPGLVDKVVFKHPPAFLLVWTSNSGRLGMVPALPMQSRAAAEAWTSTAVGFNPLLLVSSASIPWDWEETQMSGMETVGRGNMKHCTMRAGLVCKARCCQCSVLAQKQATALALQQKGVNDGSAPPWLSKQGLTLLRMNSTHLCRTPAPCAVASPAAGLQLGLKAGVNCPAGTGVYQEHSVVGHCCLCQVVLSPVGIIKASGGCLRKSILVSCPVLCYLLPSLVVLVHLLLLQVGAKKEHG